MGLLVLNPGLSTTVQDLGRTGYREYGVPIGGAFDRGSAALANALLANTRKCAVLEMTLLGGAFEARASMALALAGAAMDAQLRMRSGEARRLPIPGAFLLSEGDVVTIGGGQTGARTYLAVAGGWLTAQVLGSRSSESRLVGGQILPCASSSTPFRRTDPDLFGTPADGPIRVIDGPDAAILDPCWHGLEREYVVMPNSNRVGLRLDGPPLSAATDPNRVSTPVAPGALQLAGGRLLLLGVACGTMGGYPHVAHVIAADLDRVAQSRPGATLTFQRIALAEARRLDLASRRDRSSRLLCIATAAGDQCERYSQSD